MKLGNLDGAPVLIDDNRATPISHEGHGDPFTDPFIDAITRWHQAQQAGAGLDRTDLRQAMTRGSASVALDPRRLGPPVPRPGQIVGAPVNYRDHQREMNAAHTIAGLGFFLKSPTSVTGNDGRVELPFPDRRTDQEAELGVVIGRTASNVPVDEALDHVFGYTCLVDVTVRGDEERSTRKSFPGFTPIGPWITPASEIPDPTDLRIRGWVDGELRQDESTAQMVYGVAQLVEFISSVITLHPGDVIASGTPAGVGPVHPGSEIAVEIERVGRLEVPVVASGRPPHPMWMTRVST